MYKFLLFFACAIITTENHCYFHVADDETQAIDAQYDVKRDFYVFHTTPKINTLLAAVWLFLLLPVASFLKSVDETSSFWKTFCVRSICIATSSFCSYAFLYHVNNLLAHHKPYLYITSRGIWCRDFGFIAWNNIEKIRMTTKSQIHIISSTSSALSYYYHPIYAMNSHFFIANLLTVPLEECYWVMLHFYRQSRLQKTQ